MRPSDPTRTAADAEPAAGRSLFHNRRFTALWAAYGMTFLGDCAVRTGYPLLTLAVTGSPVTAGWVAFAANLPTLLFALPAGWAADAWNRRHILLASQLVGTMVALAVVAAVLAGGPLLLPVLVGGAFAEGTVASVTDAARLPAIRSVVTPEQRPAALSSYEAVRNSTGLVGRALGGLLFGVARWLPFGLNVVSYAGSSALIAAIPARALAPRGQNAKRPDQIRGGIRARVRGGTRAGIGAGIGESFRWVWRRPFFRFLLLTFSGTSMIFPVMQLFLIVTVRGDGAAWQVGLVLAAGGAGGVVGAWLAGAVMPRWPAARVIRVTLWLWAALLVGMAATTQVYALALLNMGVSVVGVFANVAIHTYELEAVPEELLGRVNAALDLLPGLTTLAGAALGGYLLAGLGTRDTARVLAAALTALAVLGTYSTRRAAAEAPTAVTAPREESAAEAQQRA